MAKKPKWETVYLPHIALPGKSGWMQRRKTKGFSKRGMKIFGIKIPKYEYRDWRKK